jgi:hypothetical protein
MNFQRLPEADLPTLAPADSLRAHPAALDSPVSIASGLIPRVDQFKSGIKMDRNPKQARARELLRGVIHNQ